MRRSAPRFARRGGPACGGGGASRAVTPVLTAVLTATLMVGCTPAPEPEPTTPEPTTAATEAVTEPPGPPAAPVLVPDGIADDNLPLFQQVVEQVWSGSENFAGRAYIDALTAAGFDRAAMQVTEDVSTVGDQAESIQFSVAWTDACLVGQVGPATGAPVATVVPLLPGGGCLLGRTRPIDW